jgi:hypothetical protein
MDETNLKVFSQLKQKHPDLLFFISRKTDFRVIMYNVNRQNMRLSSDVCRHVVMDLDNPEKKASPLSSVLIDNFYGFSNPVDVGNNTYKLTLNAFPDRQLKLKLKKDRALLLGTIDGVENAVILSVYMHLEWGTVIPKLDTITITGLNTKTKQLVTEDIKVTKEMLKRYDVSKIVAAYVSGK